MMEMEALSVVEERRHTLYKAWTARRAEAGARQARVALPMLSSNW